MTTVASLVDEVSLLLNDAEADYPNIRWTRGELVEYANDAAGQIAMLRPDLFEQTDTVTLKPGDRQTLPDNALFYRVDGTLDSKGQLQGRPYAADAVAARVSRLWFDAIACRDSCAARSKPYVINSWVFDPNDPSSFYVDPPVPASPPVRVVVTLSRPPQRANEDADLSADTRFHNAIIEFMLYRAFSKDEDSQTSLARSDRHKQHFYEMLGLAQRADDRLYRSATPAGEARAKSG
ncbi:DUF6682 family protein [Paraburkholderia domus]|uniref:Uncharacterized protein n=1 Tax=Paraburkholderia domus TaxID=2793075 RepID=A0A9N8R2L0_9BURK|nr:DUF6682 family protein [Paraburkholderia domus]MBK5162763.1 hypothetical protein [Burkholderia sp. R-70211]CAE6958680.1 hypothetical protein R70211_06774 [Paraburkholderia domus]